MKQLIFLAFIFFGACGYSYAQDVCPSPSGCVTITREAALKALADSDRVKALEAEIKTKDAAFDAQKALLNDMRIQFAAVSGENSALKQAAVRIDAILDLAMKHTQKSCKPFSVCF